MSEERLQEIKDSVSFQKDILLAHNMETLCVDEEEELIEEIERLNNIINEAIEYMSDTIDFSWKDNSPIKNGKSLSLNKLLNILKGSDKE